MSETTRNYDLGLTNIQVGELIGGGGFARVYRGYDSLLKRELAIKILRPVVGQDARTAFENEAGLHGPLSRHENIVTIHHAGFTVGGAHPYLVMDLVTGGSLGQHLKAQGNIVWDQAVSWMTPVCDAVQHVHDSGILHRDIKPDNILLDPPNTPLLSDLGIACLEDETSPIDAMSFPHVAPEALRGQRREAPSDVFSLGTTLYQLIAGSAPFGHALEERVVNLHAVPPPLPAEWRVPLWLEDVLQRALEPDPYLRIQTAEELGAELEAGLAGGLHPSPAVERQAVAAASASPRLAPSPEPAPTASLPPAVVDTRPRHPSAIPSVSEWSVPPMQSLYADPPPRRRPIWRALLGIALGVMLLGLAVAIIEGVGSIGADDRAPAIVELTPTTGDPATPPSDSFGAPRRPTTTVTPTTASESPTTTQPPTTGSISQNDGDEESSAGVGVVPEGRRPTTDDHDVSGSEGCDDAGGTGQSGDGDPCAGLGPELTEAPCPSVNGAIDDPAGSSGGSDCGEVVDPPTGDGAGQDAGADEAEGEGSGQGSGSGQPAGGGDEDESEPGEVDGQDEGGGDPGEGFGEQQEGNGSTDEFGATDAPAAPAPGRPTP